MEVVFDGEAYDVDRRTEWDVDNPLPSWLSPGQFDISFAGAGVGVVGAFQASLSVSAVPALSPDMPEWIEEQESHLFEWDANGADEIVVALHFNMDWDSSSIVCLPDADADQILIPAAWLDNYSWGGGGDLTVAARDEVEVVAGNALIVLKVTRAHASVFVTASD
jgi:hypothetical protein